MDLSDHIRSAPPENLQQTNHTSIICASYRPEPLLTRRIPDLQLTKLPLYLLHLKTKVNSDRRQVVLREIIIAKSNEKRGFPHALVAHDDYFELIVLITDHNIE